MNPGFPWKTLAAAALSALAVHAAGALAAGKASAPAESGELLTPRLYTADCGQVDLADMGGLSDTGDYDGKPGHLVDPCYIVRHPKGTLVWDTGMGDAIADQPGGVDKGGIHIAVPAKLVDQLQKIGLTPADVTFVAFSHLHFDHTGNAPLFTSSTWLLNNAELAWATGKPTPPPVNPDHLAPLKTVKTVKFDGDYDVFGDGTVRILAAPGHTPGHSVLMLKMKKSGTVILSGDLYHTLQNRTQRRVSTFDTHRADSLASFDRIEHIVKRTHARFVIQHAPEDFAKMPKLPAYLD